MSDASVGLSVASIIIAGLSLLVFGFTFYLQRKDKKPHLAVSARVGTIVYASSEITSQTVIVDGIVGGEEHVMYFKLINPRDKTVKVTRLSWIPPNGQRRWFLSPSGDKPLPCGIESKDRTRFWVKLEELAHQLKQDGYDGKVNCSLEVEDVLDNVYTTSFIIDADNPVTY